MWVFKISYEQNLIDHIFIIKEEMSLFVLDLAIIWRKILLSQLVFLGAQKTYIYCSKIIKFLDKTYNNSQPEFIFMKWNFFSFYMHYDIFTDDDYLQLTLMIKINNDECLNRWIIKTFFSHSLLIAQQTCKIFKNLRKSCNIIEQYLNYLLCYKNYVQYILLEIIALY